MEQESAPVPKKQLTAFGRTARRKRIFARLNEGWAYDEIAREERLTAHRVRQIVTEVLDRREVDGNSAHALLQLGRLGPAQLCRLASRRSHRCRIPRSVGSDEERRLHGERAQRERVRRHERLREEMLMKLGAARSKAPMAPSSIVAPKVYAGQRSAHAISRRNAQGTAEPLGKASDREAPGARRAKASRSNCSPRTTNSTRRAPPPPPQAFRHRSQRGAPSVGRGAQPRQGRP